MIEHQTYALPPQSVEAEESLLSRIIIDNSSFADIVGILSSNDFYRTAHKKIYAGIIRLHLKQEPIDLVTLSNILKETGDLQAIGGSTYLATIVDTVPLAVNAEHYAKIIKKASIARQLIATANKISVLAHTHDGNIMEILDDAQHQIINIGFDLDNENFATASNILMERIAQIEAMSKKGKELGIQTGFPDLDRLTGGFRGAQFIVIAARPRIGKTAFMMNMASNMAFRGHKVGIFSIEMDKEDLVDRLISSKSGINLTKLITGQTMTSEEWGKINKAAESIYKYQIIFDDTGGLHIQELKRRARKMLKDGVEIIFIDQLSKIKGGKGNGFYEKTSYLVNEIAVLKKELRVPVCLLAQINRKLEDRSNKKPTLGDLKATSSLEEDADIVLLGHRQYEYTKAEEDLRHAEWEIAKHKQGAGMNMEMDWNGKTVTFHSLERDY